MNELALFAGAGGGILGGHLLGWTTVGAVEIEKYPREVLLQRQRDGLLPPFPIWDDIRTFDGKPWRGLVDVVSGGFPCQDISVAGRGAGINGARSGLWSHMHRIICEVRPRFAFMENSPLLVSRGLYRVLGDLAESGYDAAWLVLGASDIGAPHKRERIWILAEDRETPYTDADSLQCPERRKQHERPEKPNRCGQDGVEPGREVADSSSHGWPKIEIHAGIVGKTVCEASQREPQRADGLSPDFSDGCLSRHRWREALARDAGENSQGRRTGNAWWSTEPDVGRVADGVANRVDRLKSLGNGQVPLVAATAFSTLYKILNRKENA